MSGASGGLGAGLAALGARLLPRFEVLLDHVDLDARLARADLVITAEGSLDGQTVRGKVPAEVARRAKAHGGAGPGPGRHARSGRPRGARAVGVDAYGSILPAPVRCPRRSNRGAEFLADAAERAPAHGPVGDEAGGLSGRCQPRSGTQRPSSVRYFHWAPSRTSSFTAPTKPLDVLVRGAGAEADADGVEGALARGRPARGRRTRPGSCGSEPSRVRTSGWAQKRPSRDADAVLGGEGGGEVRAVPAVDDEGDDPDARGVVAEEGEDADLGHLGEPGADGVDEVPLAGDEGVEAGLASAPCRRRRWSRTPMTFGEPASWRAAVVCHFDVHAAVRRGGPRCGRAPPPAR
ncbi:hypothetical protein Shyd_59890 [Streptomyces hydrogenans]|uniref:Glycerate kinase n=1 Tax=Streptomyces hydrogenans TaxID=1873719 RepID=A0ABQ3PHW2_9ACTN|nr:hypothetical protein Shyd_59890 [Streptomyces hydrogenans]